jgi:hypothetical protein
MKDEQGLSISTFRMLEIEGGEGGGAQKESEKERVVSLASL